MEPWNRSKEPAPVEEERKPKSEGKWKQWVAIGLALLLIGCASRRFWSWWKGRGTVAAATTEERGKPKPKAVSKPSRPMAGSPQPARLVPGTNIVSNVQIPPVPKFLPPGSHLDDVKTNSMGKIVEIWHDPSGFRHTVVKNRKKPPFKHVTDQLLAMAVSAAEHPNVRPPPLPPMRGRDLDKEFAASLMTPIVIEDDDSDKLKATKRAVLQARSDMIELLGSGMTVKQALEENHAQLSENAKLRGEAARELRSIVESGDHELAEKYRKDVNGVLERMGANPLEMPSADVDDDE